MTAGTNSISLDAVPRGPPRPSRRLCRRTCCINQAKAPAAMAAALSAKAVLAGKPVVASRPARRANR